MNTKTTSAEVKRKRAIIALLETGQPAAAAKRAGVALGTLYNWLSEEEFCSELLAAQKAAVQNAILRLAGHMNDAVGVAVEIMNNPENAPRDRTNALKVVLDFGFKSWEHTELNARLAELERMLNGEESEPDDLPEQLERQRRQEELTRRALADIEEEGDSGGEG